MIKRKSFRDLCYAASAIVGMAALIGFPLKSMAAQAPVGDDPFQALSPLSSNDLAGLRGGFAVGAFDFNIGVVISTAASSARGVHTVTTTANLIPGGQITNASTRISELPAQASAGVNGPPQTNGATMTGAENSTLVMAPTSANTTELVNGGIEFSVEGTEYSIFHAVSSEQLMTVVQNSESGVSLSTSMDINISIANFSQVLNSVTRNMPLFLGMGHDAGVASVR